MPSPTRCLFSSVAIAVLLASGCECSGATEASTGAGEGEGEAEAEGQRAHTGTIIGIVRLAPGASIPEYPESPVIAAGRPALPPECTPPRQVDRTPVIVADETGGLTSVSVVATGTDEARWHGATTREPVTHEVVIRDCRLTPSTLVATRGDRLRLTTEGAYPFFPDLGDGMQQFRSEGREIPLEQGGVRTIQCGFAAPCGRLELITLYHPVHTVSGADGRFRIENVPADEEVRVTAWHPLFREAFTTTTVPDGETVEVELVITPVQAQAPAPEPTTPPATDGPIEDRPDPTAPF